jgi:hypothetical protein
MYADMVRDAPESEHCLFVSKNRHDFSAPGKSHKTPHRDIAEYFAYPSSLRPMIARWLAAMIAFRHVR